MLKCTIFEPSAMGRLVAMQLRIFLTPIRFGLLDTVRCCRAKMCVLQPDTFPVLFLRILMGNIRSTHNGCPTITENARLENGKLVGQAGFPNRKCLPGQLGFEDLV